MFNKNIKYLNKINFNSFVGALLNFILNKCVHFFISKQVFSFVSRYGQKKAIQQR